MRQKSQHIIPDDVGIVCIYLRYNDPEQTPYNLFASIIKQLTTEASKVPQSLRDLYERHHDQISPPSLVEILEVLANLANKYSGLFFVIDALDECSDEIRWDLVERIRELRPNVHLLITSRPSDIIDSELEGFARMDIKADKADLELFIDRHISKNKNLQRVVQKSPAMRGDIKEAVVKTAEQM